MYAIVTDPAGGGESVSYVGRDEAGDPFMIAPLFPDTTDIAGGGAVEVELGGGVTSNTVDFTIEPLPAATRTVQDEVTNLQDLLTSWLALHGTSRSALRAMDPASVPIDKLFLWVAQEILDNPSNPNSLRAMVDGPVPVLDNETIDFDLANRLLSLVDGDGFFGEEIAGVDSLVSGNGPLPTSRAPGSSAAGLSAVQGCIDPGTYNISDAASLENAMMAGRFAVNRLDGASGQYLSDLGAFVGAMGMIPQLKGLATAVGGALYVYELINKAAGAVLPTSFNNSATDFDIKDKTSFYEDDAGGTWENFKVTAVSAGWQLDGEILSAIGQIAGFEDLGGLATLTEGMSQLADILTNYAVGQTVAAAINAATQGQSFVRTCPGVWPDIKLDETYVEASIPVGNSIEFTSTTFFETRRPGRSEIRVITKSGRFGGAPPALKQKPVEVLTIDVSVDPAAVQAELQETLVFIATVTNANNDKVKWTVPAGLEEISTSGDTKTITVKTPNAPWSPPFALLARSLAATGSREGKVDSDPREGGAVISIKGRGINVTPRSECVGNSETQVFTAEVVGVENPVINWSLQGWGRIEKTGEYTALYTAPSIGSTDDIVIASVEGDTLEGYAYVRVGACVCSFDISAGGWSAGGPDVAHQIFAPTPEVGIITWFFMIPDGPGGVPDNNIFSASVASVEGKPIPGPGSVGQWKMNVAYSDGNQTWAVGQEDSMASVILNVREMTSTFMEGTMIGIAVQRNDPKDPERITSRVSIHVTFRSGLWDGGRWPCTEEPAELPQIPPALLEVQVRHVNQ